MIAQITEAQRRGAQCGSYQYCFSEADAKRAFDEWGCNCGPTALAFAARVGLDVVRPEIPGFDEKRYTSPTMMFKAVINLGLSYVPIPCAPRSDALPGALDSSIALVRIQWTGPWTAPGANPRWAYRQTHWICAWIALNAGPVIFDVNGGIRSLRSWQEEIVPDLLAGVKRADGGWYPTHVWRLTSDF